MVRHAQHQRMGAALAAVLLLTAAAPPLPSPGYDRAIAAGYKALTLCSGLFNAKAVLAKRTRDSVERHELHGIYPEYDAIVGKLPAEARNDRVLVSFDETLAPRVAVAKARAGCTIYPIGTPPDEPKPDLVISSDDRPRRGWPLDDRERIIAPRGQMAQAIDTAFANAGGTDTTAVVVIRDGRLIGERYADGFGPLVPQRTWSVAKSMSGTLIGLAGSDPHRPARVPEWQTPGDPRQAITLDDLLRMASGLHSDTAGNRTDSIYFGGTAVTEEATAWPIEAKHGTRFRYANNDILLAIRALRATLGEDRYETFPDAALFAPLDMAHTIAERDWKGNYILSSQVWSTARDLARLGQFWLQDGVWQGQRLLPKGWMTYMTTPSGPQPADGPGYGATMWLFGPKQGLPVGSYAAQGNRGQFVMIVPSEKLVVVRRGEDPGAARFDIAAFTAKVIEALK